MILKEVVPMAVSPVPLEEFSAHLRLGHGFVDDGSEAGLIGRYLLAAQAVVEGHTGQALTRRGYLLVTDRWGRGDLRLPIGPVERIDAVRFVRGAEVVVVPGEFDVAPGVQGQVVRLGGGCLPPIPPGWVAEVAFEAGHADDWDGVPRDLAQAVLVLAASYYEARAQGAPGLPGGVGALLQPHRLMRL